MTICETTGAGRRAEARSSDGGFGQESETSACRFRIRHAGEVRVGQRRMTRGHSQRADRPFTGRMHGTGVRDKRISVLILVVWLTRKTFPLCACVGMDLPSSIAFSISGELSRATGSKIRTGAGVEAASERGIAS
jgi:hypothetical protein